MKVKVKYTRSEKKCLKLLKENNYFISFMFDEIAEYSYGSFKYMSFPAGSLSTLKNNANRCGITMALKDIFKNCEWIVPTDVINDKSKIIEHFLLHGYEVDDYASIKIAEDINQLIGRYIKKGNDIYEVVSVINYNNWDGPRYCKSLDVKNLVTGETSTVKPEFFIESTESTSLLTREQMIEIIFEKLLISSSNNTGTKKSK